MDEEKLSFIEAKRLTKTIEKEAEKEKSGSNSMRPELKGVTNPIQAAFLKFSASKHKFNLKDI